MEPSQDVNKQIQARKQIERYFYQLTEGCGKPECNNNFCASSPLFSEKLTGNQAAIKSLQLYVEHAKLCDKIPPSSSATTTPVIKDIEMNDVAVKSQ